MLIFLLTLELKNESGINKNEFKPAIISVYINNEFAI